MKNMNFILNLRLIENKSSKDSVIYDDTFI